MRQVVYTSINSSRDGKADVGAILEQSRHNNALDGVTGLLWSDGTYFAQVIEGPAASVETTLSRILADSRHRDIEIRRDVDIDEREFGDWTMIHRQSRDSADNYDMRMRRLLGTASPDITEPFLQLMATGHLSRADAGGLPVQA